MLRLELFFFFSSRRRHTRLQGDWSSDVCSSDLSCSFSVTSVCASVLESPTLKCPPMTPPSASPHSFDKLALSPATLANLERLGYPGMTAVQLASPPPALRGQDVIAQAHTGSGQTAAF